MVVTVARRGVYGCVVPVNLVHVRVDEQGSTVVLLGVVGTVLSRC